MGAQDVNRRILGTDWLMFASVLSRSHWLVKFLIAYAAKTLIGWLLRCYGLIHKTMHSKMEATEPSNLIKVENTNCRSALKPAFFKR